MAMHRNKIGSNMTKSNTLPKLPDVICKALDAYATHMYMQDRGYGKEVNKAELKWLDTRKRLVRWLNRNKNKPKVIIVNSNSNL